MTDETQRPWFRRIYRGFTIESRKPDHHWEFHLESHLPGREIHSPYGSHFALGMLQFGQSHTHFKPDGSCDWSRGKSWWFRVWFLFWSIQFGREHRYDEDDRCP